MSAFDKVIGYEEIKTELIRFCDVIKNPGKYSRLGVDIPGGILLYGIPGLGKTLLAKCFIEESGIKALTLRKDKPNGEFVEEIKKTFDKARAEEPSIVFLDDMDKYANEDPLHRDAEEYVTIQSCIDEVKGRHVFVIATANNRYDMPDSLLRPGRFDKIIELKTPEGKESEAIISYFLNQKRLNDDVDIDVISRLMSGFSCADLESVINEAGIIAGFKNNNSICQEDIINACIRFLFESPDCSGSYSNSCRKIVAVHEAGHVLVSEVLDPGSVTLVTLSKTMGVRKGLTVTRKPDNYSFFMKPREQDVMVNLGGKAAVEIVCGEIDMGSSGDINTAFSIVESFVTENCSLGFEPFEFADPSQSVRHKRECLISTEIEKYYQQAKKLIAENRRFLDGITKELLKHETLTYRDIRRIREKTA